MKKSNLYVLSFLILILLFSCKKDSLLNNEIQNKEIPEIELIDHKFNNNDGPDKNPL
jgi:hypothetical protein